MGFSFFLSFFLSSFFFFVVVVVVLKQKLSVQCIRYNRPQPARLF